MRNTKQIRGIALAGFGLLALVGCDSLRIEQGVLNGKDPGSFRCDSNDDCLNGYRCIQASSVQGGVCTEIGVGRECAQYNMDGDQYLAIGAPEECFGEATDCDDNDPNTYPDAIELCDGVDNNCDGQIDEGLGQIPCALQIGVCAGAVSSCVDGGIVDCAESGAYAAAATANGLVYSETEICGDGVDNNCDGRIDEGCCDTALPTSGPNSGSNAECRCVPGQAFACGRETGTCTRGIQICDESVAISDLACLATEVADLGPCTLGDTHADDDVFCVKEFIRPNEDLYDACEVASDPGCERTVYRRLASGSGTSCSSNAECSSGETCAAGECRGGNIEPTAEICNGLDDDCDGSIDNHYGNSRTAPCGHCPFNSVRMELASVLTAGASQQWQCVDVYEASRPDATADDAGTDTRYAVSAANVIPWTGIDGNSARDACQGTEYRDLFRNNTDAQRSIAPRVLCLRDAWAQACAGTSGLPVRPYPWGSSAVAGRCNDHSNGGAGLVPTGSMEDCSNPNALPGRTDGRKVYDMIGNAREWVAVSSAITRGLAGGGYNDGTGLAICTPEATAPQGTVLPNQAVIFPYGGVSCAGDPALCPSGSICNSGNGLCVMSASNALCLTGNTTTVGGSSACAYPAVGASQWESLDDAGFRCCSQSLAD